MFRVFYFVFMKTEIVLNDFLGMHTDRDKSCPIFLGISANRSKLIPVTVLYYDITSLTGFWQVKSVSLKTEQ